MSRSASIKIFYYEMSLKNNSGQEITPSNYPHYIEQVIKMQFAGKTEVVTNTEKKLITIERNGKVTSKYEDITTHQTKISQSGINNTYTFDYFYLNNYIFISMSRPQELHNTRKQNLETLEQNNIELSENEAIIKSSYMLIDCKDGVVSFIYNRSTPSIDVFIYLLNGRKVTTTTGNEITLNFNISKIPNSIIIDRDSIKKVSSLEFQLALPVNSILDRISVFGTTRNLLNRKIRNTKTRIEIKGVNSNDEESIDGIIDLINGINALNNETIEPNNRFLEKLDLIGKIADSEKYVSKHDLIDSKFNVFTKYKFENAYTPVDVLKMRRIMIEEYEKVSEKIKSKLTNE